MYFYNFTKIVLNQNFAKQVAVTKTDLDRAYGVKSTVSIYNIKQFKTFTQLSSVNLLLRCTF